MKRLARLVIYAHYDADARVKRYVTHALEALRRDCDRIVFVSTAPLAAHETDKVRPLCDTVILRENVGWDFGMWQRALEDVDRTAWDELVLMNSSVVGPLVPLAPIFERMQATECDFWGPTECATDAPHLQSYFLVFRERLLRSESFAAFWRSVLPYRDKHQVIRSYEIGLTRFFVDQGFRYETMLRARDLYLALRRGRFAREPRGRLARARRTVDAWGRSLDAMNPTHAYPLEAVALGAPFVKYIHFRDNPKRLPRELLYATLERAGLPRALVDDAG